MRALVLLLLVLLSLNIAAASTPASPPSEGEGLEARFIAFGPQLDPLKSVIESIGGKVTEKFELLGGVVFEGPTEIAERLSALGYYVAPERSYQTMQPFSFDAEPMLSSGAPAIGAPSAWQRGLNGTGVKVAIIDAGVENSHPWLIRRGSSVVKWEFNATDRRVVDYCGRGRSATFHGTFVAGIIASQSSDTPGVAPGVELYDIIVYSEADGCGSTTDTIVARAFEAAMRGPDGRVNSGDEADVIVLNFGFLARPEVAFAIKNGRIRVPVLEVLERVAREKVVIVGAGDGRAVNYYNSLCLASGVICVGASNHVNTPDPRDDALAHFSSRGPAFPGMMVPHLVAPGLSILSAAPREAGTTRTFSGTSVAAPFVAGAAAIIVQYLRQQGMSATPQEVLSALMQTARDVKPPVIRERWIGANIPHLAATLDDGIPPITTVADQGGGQVDLTSALSREVLMLHNNLPFAHLYGNTGDMEISIANLLDRALSLRIEVRAVDVYTFKNVSSRFIAPREISLSPKGSALLKVSFRELAPGTYGGYIILRSDTGTHRFPFLVTSPVRLGAEGVASSNIVDTSIATRHIRLDRTLVFIEVERSILEPVSIHLITKSSSERHITSTAGSASFAWFTITSPAGGLSQRPHSFLFTQRGSYLLSLYFYYSLIGYPELTFRTNVSLVIGPALPLTNATNIEKVLEDAMKGVIGRVNALEGAVRSVNASFSALRTSIEALRNELSKGVEGRRGEISRLQSELSREVEERRREISKINQSIAALLSIVRSLEENLSVARTELRSVGERMGKANSSLASAVRNEVERANKLEGEVKAMQQELSSLSQELKSLEEKLVERERELRNVRGGQDVSRLMAIGAALIAFVSLAISGFLFLRRGTRAKALLLLLLLNLSITANASLQSTQQDMGESFTGKFIAIGPSAQGAKVTIEALGGRVTEEFELVGGAAFEGSLKVVERLSSLGYIVAPERTYMLMRPFSTDIEPMISHGTPTIGAPSAWQRGLNGTGVRVAIIDTGIENNHPWLMRRGASVVRWEFNATDARIGDYCMRPVGTPEWRGTHAAGIVASQDRDNRGVAPGADIYDIIVFSPKDDCFVTTDSFLIRGIEAALRGPDGRPNSGDEADVIAVNAGFPIMPEAAFGIKRGLSKVPIIELLERVAREKVVVVGASEGTATNFYNALCLAGGVICVGASSHERTPDPSDDTLDPWVSKGPGLPGMMVPHMIAPGYLIWSAAPTPLTRSIPSSGSSVAASFVAGAAAIMIQYFRQQGVSPVPQEVMAALMQTARDVRPPGNPPVVTIADQGAGQIDIRAALDREIRLAHNNLPFAHLYGNSGTLEIATTSLVGSALSLSVQVRALDVYTFKNVSARFNAQQQISLSPRGSVVLRVTFDNLDPGTYGGYVLLRSASGSYRFPFLVTSPLRLSWEGSGFVKTLNASIFIRDYRDRMFDRPTFFIDVGRPLPEPVMISLIVHSSHNSASLGRFTLTTPSGGLSHNPSIHHFTERGAYMITISTFEFLFGSPSNVSISLVFSAPSPISNATGLAKTLEAVKSVITRIGILESTLRSINASLPAVRSSLEILRSELSKEREERRAEIARIDEIASKVIEERKREIARIDQIIATLQSTTRSAEESLRTSRTELLTLSERLTRLNSTLAATIRTEVERVMRLEGEARVLQQTLSSLLQELKSLEAKITDKEIRELLGEQSTARLIAVAAVLMALASLAISGYLLFRRRK